MKTLQQSHCFLSEPESSQIPLCQICRYAVLCTGLVDRSTNSCHSLSVVEEKFQSHTAGMATTLQLDIVLMSVQQETVLLELTVQWEDHMEEVFEKKLSKYSELVSKCLQQLGN